MFKHIYFKRIDICLDAILIFFSLPLFAQDIVVNIEHESGLNAHDGSIALVVQEVGVNNSGPFHFSWTDQNGTLLLDETDYAGVSTLTNLAPGTYLVHVENTDGCEATSTFEICAALLKNEFINDANSSENIPGKIYLEVFGNENDYGFSWEGPGGGIANDGPGILAEQPGEYSVTVTNPDGCQIVETFIIKDCNGETANVTVIEMDITKPYTHCSSDGAIDILPFGGEPPYSFQWECEIYPWFSANTEDIDGLLTGEYCVTVSDIHCNEGYYCKKIYPQLDIGIGVWACQYTDMMCTQNLDMGRKGGTPPYTYSWDNGATTEDNFGLEPGQSYCVTVTDTHGCSQVGCFEVAPPRRYRYHRSNPRHLSRSK